MSEPIRVVAAVIRNKNASDSRVLLVRRGPDQSGAGDWEFPGGKIEIGETPENALKREIHEELNISILVKDLIGEMDFKYPSKTIRLRVYWAEMIDGVIALTDHDLMKWVFPQDIETQELSPADRPFVSLLGK